MDRRLRRAPDAEWVLMYRSGLSRARIAALVRAEPATIGYHLVIAWVTAEGRFPKTKAAEAHERSLAAWPSRRRREEAGKTLHPAYSAGLARVPGWAGNCRATQDEARWRDRLAQLIAFRDEGNDFPRHHHYASEREHTLGVWIHTQRYTHRAGDLDPVKLKLLDEAVPGWQTRTNPRPPTPAMTGAVGPLVCQPWDRQPFKG